MNKLVSRNLCFAIIYPKQIHFPSDLIIGCVTRQLGRPMLNTTAGGLAARFSTNRAKLPSWRINFGSQICPLLSWTVQSSARVGKLIHGNLLDQGLGKLRSAAQWPNLGRAWCASALGGRVQGAAKWLFKMKRFYLCAQQVLNCWPKSKKSQ